MKTAHDLVLAAKSRCTEVPIADAPAALLRIAAACALAREMVDTPAADMGPLQIETIAREIAALARSYQRDALRIDTVQRNRPHADIEYRAIRVAPNEVELGVVNVLRLFDAADRIDLEQAEALWRRYAAGAARRAGHEALVLPDGRELRPGAASPGLQLVQQVRDEAHRFAITGHRGKRQKARSSSRLEDIAGIGPRRRASLLRHFGGLSGLKAAAVDDIARAYGPVHPFTVAAQRGLPAAGATIEVADAEGRYHFEGLMPGTHVVEAQDSTLPAGGQFVDCARSTRSAGSATSPSTRVIGKADSPARASKPLTAVLSAKAIGCWARLKRSTSKPFCRAQSRSAEKLTKAWSTSVPQTPLLQHRAGSNT